MDICGQDYQTGGIWADSVDGKKDVGYCECEAMCNAVADCKGFNSGNYNDNYYQCYLFNDEFSDTPDVPSWLGKWDPRCYVRQDSRENFFYRFLKVILRKFFCERLIEKK